MNIKVEIGNQELRNMLMLRLAELMPETTLTDQDIRIEVKSKQNYKAEWEDAEVRAWVEKKGI